MSARNTHEPTFELPARPRDGHKGTFGRVLILGGCAEVAPRMLGAPALAARAALRCGAGLVTIAAPAPLLDAMLTLTPSATGVALPCDASGALIPHACVEVLDASGVLARADAVVVGPGFGVNPGSQALTLRAIQHPIAPVVVDADALGVLAQLPDVSKDMRAPCVLTPHPGEFRRLANALGIDLGADTMPSNPSGRTALAETLARRLGCIVVLKGAGTVVSDGLESWTCARGHPCLATAGTGDVLGGVLGGLLAQHMAQHAAPGSVDIPPDLRSLALQRLRERGSAVANPSAASQPTRAPDMQHRGTTSLRALVQAGVEAHARAGEAWARAHHAEAGLLALELADMMPAQLQAMRDASSLRAGNA